MRMLLLLLLVGQLAAPAGLRVTVGLIPRTSAELQAALFVGGAITLLPNTLYTGNFIARKSCSLSTIGIPTALRATPINTYAKLVSGNGAAVLTILASDVTVQRVSFPDSISSDTVQVGQLDEQINPSQQPRNVRLDQIVIQGAAVGGAKRGVALHCGGCSVTNSYIADIKRVGQDTQAIWILNGTGPFDIRNNYLEAAGETLMVGGDNPRIPDLVPENISIRDNTFTKNPAWRAEKWTVKNLLELKVGRHVIIENNLFENLWQAGQPGWSIVFTPQGLPSVQVSDVRFLNNIVRNVSSGFNILGHAQIGTSLQTMDIVIDHNWFVLSRTLYGGQGWFMQLGLGAARIAVTFNTIEQDGNQFVAGTGAPVPDFQFHSNIVSRVGQYGLFLQDASGTNRTGGTRWQEFFPGGMIEDNAFVGASSALRTNIPTNLFATEASIVNGRGTGSFANYGR